MKGSTLLTFATLFAFALGTCDFSGDICSILSNGILERQTSQCASSSLNSIQVGNNSYPGYEFDVVSFNDVTITHGDVQGRVATRNNFYALSGVSIGDQITVDTMYSLIAGGDAIWTGSGATYPAAEDIFVGGSVSAPTDIASRVAGNCSSAGCISSSFDNLATYWVSVSNALAQGTNNVNVSYLNGVASLSCESFTSNAARSDDDDDDSSSTSTSASGSNGSGSSSSSSVPSTLYYVNIDAIDFNQITGYSVSSSCSSSASWIFNIGGTSDVAFNGNSITAAGYVVFNIVSGARIVQVISSVNGNILAPTASFNQVGGTVYGQVIAENITNIVQVNRPACPFSSDSSSSGSAASSSTETLASGSASSSAASTASASSASTASNSGGQSNSGVVNNESQGNAAIALVPAIAVLLLSIMMM